MDTNQDKARIQSELQTIVAKFREAYPVTQAIIDDGDLEGFRKHLIEHVRAAKDEGDVVGLAIIAGWLLMHAPASLLYQYSAWIESEDLQ